MQSNHFICHLLLLLSSVFPSIRVFLNESPLCIRWPKYWSFSFNISPSDEHSGLDFLYDGLVGSPCSPRDSQESFLTEQCKCINSLAPSFLYSWTLTSIHDYWKNHSLDWMDLCQQINVGAISSVQFSSVAQLFPTLCDCCMPGLPVHHQLPEFTQLMSI